MRGNREAYLDDSVVLNADQKRVLDIIENTNDNLFVTGKAGTGKSTLLRYIEKHIGGQTAILAPTGVAALNIGGQTIHSFFCMSPEVQDVEDQDSVTDMGYRRKTMLAQLDTLIIDEISMVSADIMDMIDAKLKYARGNKKPFGGCRVIVFGDLFQLPPVVTSGQVSRFLEDRYGTVYYFGAKEIQKHPFRKVELEKVCRQNESFFIDILNKVRTGDVNSATLDDINSCCRIPPRDKQFVTLTSDNATSDRINLQGLEKLDSKEWIYDGEVEGDISQSSMPTELHLRLKLGAQVMIIVNDHTDNSSKDFDKKARWVNGTIGIVSGLSHSGIRVNINGVNHWIDRVSWTKYQYSYDEEKKELVKEAVATFTQFPIKLAYAMTIHKSQGRTYEAVNIDLNHGAFAAGQVYVALSRCKTMSNLYLAKALRKNDIIVSQEVINIMRNWTNKYSASRAGNFAI